MDPVTVTIIVILGTVIIIQAVNLLIKIPICESPYGFTAVIIMNPEDDVEMKIENIIHKLRWTDDELIKKVILIDNGLNLCQAELCRQYCDENRFIEIVKPDDVLKIIFSCEKNDVK